MGYFLSLVNRKKKHNLMVVSFFSLSFSPLQIVQMDLSSSIIPTSALESIICRCRLLENLSLEGLQLSDAIIRQVFNSPTHSLHCHPPTEQTPPALFHLRRET